MKFTVFYFFTLVLITGVTSCEQEECCQPEVPSDLEGAWLLTERGYSPGDRYIVEPVSPVPAQTINLMEDQQFSSNIDGLTDFGFYEVVNDPQSEGRILALFEAPPGHDLDLDNLSHSYNVVFEEGILKLYFRYCFEGCHMGFIKSDS